MKQVQNTIISQVLPSVVVIISLCRQSRNRFILRLIQWLLLGETPIYKIMLTISCVFRIRHIIYLHVQRVYIGTPLFLFSRFFLFSLTVDCVPFPLSLFCNPVKLKLIRLR